MKAKEIRAYQSTIRNGHPADVEYYRKVMAGCEEYPFEGAGSTALSRAIWLDMKGKLEVRQMNKYKRYLVDSGLTAKVLAHKVGISRNTMYYVLRGRYDRPATKLVDDYMATHPISGPVPVDLRNWRQAVRKLDSLIDSGKVRNIEIRVEVQA